MRAAADSAGDSSTRTPYRRISQALTSHGTDLPHEHRLSSEKRRSIFSGSGFPVRTSRVSSAIICREACSHADEWMLANGTLLPEVIGRAPDAQWEVRMLAILPSVFTEADYDAGYRYEPSILQAEFSMAPGLDRQVLVVGRVLFEQVIRGNLESGRPDRVSLIVPRPRLLSFADGQAGPVSVPPALPSGGQRETVLRPAMSR